MKNFTAKDLMVPISEYATVPEGATLFEAVMALEKAQEEFSHNRYSHRAVLVMSKDKRVVGKLSQVDFLRALEMNEAPAENRSDLQKFGFSAKAIVSHQEQRRVDTTSREELIKAAAGLKVVDCMQALSGGEYIELNTSVNTAAHQLITGRHLSLLVTDGVDIVGVLRLSDVFAAAFHAMKEIEKKEMT